MFSEISKIIKVFAMVAKIILTWFYYCSVYNGTRRVVLSLIVRWHYGTVHILLWGKIQH